MLNVLTQQTLRQERTVPKYRIEEGGNFGRRARSLDPSRKRAVADPLEAGVPAVAAGFGEVRPADRGRKTPLGFERGRWHVVRHRPVVRLENNE